MKNTFGLSTEKVVNAKNIFYFAISSSMPKQKRKLEKNDKDDDDVDIIKPIEDSQYISEVDTDDGDDEDDEESDEDSENGNDDDDEDTNNEDLKVSDTSHNTNEEGNILSNKKEHDIMMKNSEDKQVKQSQLLKNSEDKQVKQSQLLKNSEGKPSQLLKNKNDNLFSINESSNNSIKSISKDVKTEKEKKKKGLSASTIKNKMSPYMLQNPTRRKIIWKNIQMMMEYRGYKWIQDKPEPTIYQDLIPDNKWVLGTFHMHAEHEKNENVYVIFCAKSGYPTLRKIEYPSRHIILVSDTLTGRARAVLQNLNITNVPLKGHYKDGKMEKEIVKREKIGTLKTRKLEKEKVVMKPGEKDIPKIEEPNPIKLYKLNEIYIEAFPSSFFMFNLLKQRYLNSIEFKPLQKKEEIQPIFDIYEKNSDLNRLPKFNVEDPIVRFFRLSENNIVELKRLSSSAGEHFSYRTVASPKFT